MKYIPFAAGFALLLSFFATTYTYAQPRRERIEAVKVAFITERLQLTPQEAQAFWPLYNDYQEKVKALRKQARAERDDLDGMNDADIEKLIYTRLDAEARINTMQHDMVAQLKKVISVRKIIKLYTAEHEFKARLIEQMRGKQGDGPMRPPK